MIRKTFTLEQIINKMRAAEGHINRSISLSESNSKIIITEQAYYH